MKRLSTLITLIFPLSFFAQNVDYFQQQVDHVIHVELDDMRHELEADIRTSYINNSPDELGEIWMHLWPNAYSSAETALARQLFQGGDMFMFYALAKDLGGIDKIDFKVDGVDVVWAYDPENPDIALITLNNPLPPGDSIEITTPFHVRIPSGKISRLGHVGESYQITQWYPKPAVYDRDGWHPMPYLGQGEFYSEFGSFDVHITLPDNYSIGATGDMPEDENNDNNAEVKRLELLDRNTRDYFNTIDSLGIEFDTDNSFPKSSTRSKTLHYHQENVHDFAWFADKRFKVLKDSVELPHSGRVVTSWAMFTPNEEELWKQASTYLNKSTYYYSLWNGDYPYNHVTAIDGTISAGGGMEYPNVTVIGASGTAFALDVVIAHEVGHNWFYGILGSNERDNAWMDEGLNSFNETRYLMEVYEGKDLGLLSSRLSPKWIKRLGLEDFEYRWIDELAYIFPARLGTDQALQCHSIEFSEMNYGAMVYKKTAAVFGFLRQYLGTIRFDKAMQAYFKEWKFKHPSPSDLQASIENSTGEDLDWFFDGWIKTTKKNDWAITRVKKNDGSVSVTLVNNGKQKSPVEVVVFNDDLVVGRTWGYPSEESIWTTVEIPCLSSTHVVVDPDRYDLDYDRQNNRSRTSGLFKKIEPLQIKLGTRLEDGGKTQLFWLPTMAWNQHNGLMMGTTFHNTTLPLRNFEWRVTPLFSRVGEENETTLSGIANISYSSGPWNMNLNGRLFESQSDLTRVSFDVQRKINKVVNSTMSSSLKYEFARVQGMVMGRFYSNDPRISNKLRYEVVRSNGKTVGLVHNLGLEVNNYNISYIPDDPWSSRAESYNTNTASLNYSIDQRVNKKGRRIKMSVLAVASFLSDSLDKFKIPTSGFSSRYDPMASELFLNRGNGLEPGLLGAQAPMLYGALPLQYYAQDWMASARFDFDLTKSIEMFAGVLVFDDMNYDFVYGLTYSLGPLKVQMPLYSPMMVALNPGNYDPYRHWRFSLNLTELNPWKLIRNY